MFNFGDELLVESYKIPWLIWIQLLVTFLLIVLLYYFGLFALDLSVDTSSSVTALPSTGLFISKESRKYNPTTTITSCLQVGGNQIIKGEIASGTSRRVIEREDSSEEEDFTVSETSHHPCYLVRLAREAFLKCLGLDETTTSTREQTKRD